MSYRFLSALIIIIFIGLGAFLIKHPILLVGVLAFVILSVWFLEDIKKE